VKSLALALGYSMSWGFGLTLSKLGLAYFQPLTLLVIQLCSSLAFLSLLLLVRDGTAGLRRISPRYGAAGILEPGLAYLLGTVGLSMTSAVSASLIGTSEVLVTILAAALILREPVSSVRLMLAAVGTVGVALIALADISGPAMRSTTGDLLVFAGVLCATGYALLSAPMARKINPLPLVISQQILGLATVLPIWLLLSSKEIFLSPTLTPHLGAWLLAVTAGVLQYALAFYFYLSAVSTMDVSRATLFLILIPVFSAISAMALLGEGLALLQVVGGAIILVAAYLASLEKAE